MRLESDDERQKVRDAIAAKFTKRLLHGADEEEVGTVTERPAWTPDPSVEPIVDVRPVTRADCKDGPRPCPWFGCKHHIGIDVLGSRIRRVGASFGRRESDDDIVDAIMDSDHDTCVLDVVDREGEQTLEQVGARLDITRERIRQIEQKALDKLQEITPNDTDFRRERFMDDLELEDDVEDKPVAKELTLPPQTASVDWMSTQGASLLLGCDGARVYYLAKQGKIKTRVGNGRSKQFYRPDVLALRESEQMRSKAVPLPSGVSEKKKKKVHLDVLDAVPISLVALLVSAISMVLVLWKH